MPTLKPRIMQEELLVKFKEEYGQLPIWNTKKKLEVKAKKAPVSDRKEAPSLKTKPAIHKKTVKPKQTPKAKIVSAKKINAKAETPVKSEMPIKEETSTQPSEQEKLSNSEMNS